MFNLSYLLFSTPINHRPLSKQMELNKYRRKARLAGYTYLGDAYISVKQPWRILLFIIIAITSIAFSCRQSPCSHAHQIFMSYFFKIYSLPDSPWIKRLISLWMENRHGAVWKGTESSCSQWHLPTHRGFFKWKQNFICTCRRRLFCHIWTFQHTSSVRFHTCVSTPFFPYDVLFI